MTRCFRLSDSMKFLRVEKMELGPIGTNAYLLWEKNGGDAVLIDAPPDCRIAIQTILDQESLTLKEIWLTHGHWDHMAGAAEIVNDQMTVIGHREDQTFLSNHLLCQPLLCLE